MTQHTRGDTVWDCDREHLRLYARLRGLDEDTVKREAEGGLRRLGLLAYADRRAGTYSGIPKNSN